MSREQNQGTRAVNAGEDAYQLRNFDLAAERFKAAAESFKAAEDKFRDDGLVDNAEQNKVNMQIAYLNQGASLVKADKPDEAIVVFLAAQETGLNSPELVSKLADARYNSGLKLYNEADTEAKYLSVIAREDIDPSFKLQSYCKLAALKSGAEGELDALLEAREFYVALENKALHQNEANFIFSHLAALYLSEHDDTQLSELLNGVDDVVQLWIVGQLKELASHENAIRDHTSQTMHMRATLFNVLEGDAKEDALSELNNCARSHGHHEFAKVVVAGAVDAEYAIAHTAIDNLFA